jgi:hypothetical protein
LFGSEGRDVRGELGEVAGDQNQALALRPTLDLEDALHSPAVGRIAAKAEHRFGGIGDDAARAKIVL